MTRQQRLALLPAAALIAIAVAAFVVGQVVPGFVVLLLAVPLGVLSQLILRRSTSTRSTTVLIVVAVAVVARIGIAVADGYMAERLSKCHTPSKTERRLVEAVADETVASLVAVRHRSTSYLAAKVPGEQEAAVFGTDGREIRAVNEAARDASSAEFDFLYGTGEVLVIKGDTSAQEGRERAIARVGACALGAATNR